jgi:chemotaxis-related protein WspB
METGSSRKLFVSVTIGKEIYAIDAGAIVEILPLIAINRVPHAPSGIAGTIGYRGMPVPVLDLSELILGAPAPERLGTRILVVIAGDASLFGLLAANATETFRFRDSDFGVSDILRASTPFLGPVATGPRGEVRRIELETLLMPYRAMNTPAVP